MGLLKAFSNKTTSPKEVAKDRLKLILIHDRGDIDPETIDKIRGEILQVLSKYIEIEADDVEIALNKVGGNEDGNGPAIIANIPIKNMRTR
ncbi:MAG: cell division topological specificity factor MinE [Clostridium sp.]|nr:cell division topological specificity factor MinE [Clostridium sp.]